MQIPVALRRLAYRVAYRLLCLRWRLPHPVKLGVKCLLTSGDRCLLVRHTYGDRVWDLPGGGIKRHEEPLAAAHREMQEELGVDGVAWRALGVINGIDHRRRDAIHCFIGELDSPSLVLDPGELAAAEWFPRAKLPARLGPYVEAVVSRALAEGPLADDPLANDPLANGPLANGPLADGPGSAEPARNRSSSG